MPANLPFEPPEGFVPRPLHGFEELIGPMLTRVTETGELRMGFQVDASHVNGRNGCHGGMLLAFADIAWGMPLAAHGYDDGWATVRLTTDFLAPAALGDWLEAASEVVGRDGDLFTVVGRIWTGERMLMSGTALYKGFRQRSGV